MFKVFVSLLSGHASYLKERALFFVWKQQHTAYFMLSKQTQNSICGSALKTRRKYFVTNQVLHSAWDC